MLGRVPEHLESLNFESPVEDAEVEFRAPSEPERAKSCRSLDCSASSNADGAKVPDFLSQPDSAAASAWPHFRLSPILVAIFALNGLPAVQNLSMGLDLNVVKQLEESMSFLCASQQNRALSPGS